MFAGNGSPRIFGLEYCGRLVYIFQYLCTMFGELGCVLCSPETVAFTFWGGCLHSVAVMVASHVRRVRGVKYFRCTGSSKRIVWFMMLQIHG